MLQQTSIPYIPFPSLEAILVSLTVETDESCSSTVLEQQVVINRLPLAEFETPDACVNDLAVAI